ncbi:MAG: ATPase, T2SS/T4P/T4SS family [Candidatus Omnitrophota bacterium]
MAETLKEKIINSLIESQKLTAKDMDLARALQKEKNISLDKALLEKGLINEKDLLVLLVKELRIPFINLSKYKIDPHLKEIIPEKIARQYRIVPISQLSETITVALADPLNIFVIDDLKNITGREIDVIMSTESDIISALDSYYGLKTSTTVKDVSRDIDVEDFEIIAEKDSKEEDVRMDEGEQAPIIRMVNLVIQEALKQRASDIHIEPQADTVRVRYRIDGILQDILDIPKENQNAVIIRIKIMSRIDITATRIPQDGRFKMKTSSQEVDFRVSMLPTTFGQKIVMRVLDKQSLSVGLNGLGFSEKSMALLKEAIRKPFGMILVTGPTGSGKSTTLYSVISELNTVDKNIISVEDPVEYLVEGLTQIQVRAEIGLTFASGLRSILRQSPDIVMIGEIRDNETADIAIKASLTGQLVFSTLHTNDAAGALTRLVDMGVEPFLVASSLVLVCAQRLCRKICSRCKEEIPIPKELFKEKKIEIKSGGKIYHGKGCKFCRNTGYSGRLGITEVLEIDESIRDMLVKGKSSDEIKQYAIKHNGMTTLWEDCLQKLFSGITTVEEVLRITSSE